MNNYPKKILQNIKYQHKQNHITWSFLPEIFKINGDDLWITLSIPIQKTKKQRKSEMKTRAVGYNSIQNRNLILRLSTKNLNLDPLTSIPTQITHKLWKIGFSFSSLPLGHYSFTPRKWECFVFFFSLRFFIFSLREKKMQRIFREWDLKK